VTSGTRLSGIGWLKVVVNRRTNERSISSRGNFWRGTAEFFLLRMMSHTLYPDRAQLDGMGRKVRAYRSFS
jgi:hypothetical protein